MCRLRLGRLGVIGEVGCSGQSAVPVTISAQLRANRLDALLMKWAGRLRLGRLLAFGVAGCLGAIGHTSAQLGPAAAQSAPCLGRLFPLGLAYPGTNPPTVAPKAVKVPRSLIAGLLQVFIFRTHWPHRLRRSESV